MKFDRDKYGNGPIVLVAATVLFFVLAIGLAGVGVGGAESAGGCVGPSH